MAGGRARDGEKAPMDAWFGSVSRKSTEIDLLAREKRTLAIHWTGLGGADASALVYDGDDLDLAAGVDDAAAWVRIVADWPVRQARSLLPWAVVHQAVRAPIVVLCHADAVCAAANAPDGPSTSNEVFGPGVTWLPFASPGPALARAVAGLAGDGAALIQHVGLMAWGATEEAVRDRLAALDTAASAWLDGRRGGAPGGSPGRVGPADERLVVNLRGRASGSRRMVLAVDGGLAAMADRPDVERIVHDAPGAEMTWPWDPGANAIGGVDGARADLPDGHVNLVAGLGLVSAGPDEAAARALNVVAGHVHRLTAALIDVFGSFESLPAGERTPPGRLGDDTTVGDGPPARGRVYIVTGAASGIGRDVARHLAAAGASLGLGDLNAEALERTADELEPLAGRPVTVAGDLTDEGVVERLVTATVARFGGVDGAVLNAGIALPGEIRSLALEDWRRSLEVNATSHFLLARRLLPVLEAQGLGGSLVFIGSKNMFSPGAGFGAYSASKAALAQLARVVAIEAGPYGVRSNIVNPDNVFGGSALWSPELRAQRAAVYGIKPEDLEAYYTKRNLMKVAITGQDIAKAVAFMLSDDAMRTTACVLTVDGGVPGVFPR